MWLKDVPGQRALNSVQHRRALKSLALPMLGEKHTWVMGKPMAKTLAKSNRYCLYFVCD